MNIVKIVFLYKGTADEQDLEHHRIRIEINGRQVAQFNFDESPCESDEEGGFFINDFTDFYNIPDIMRQIVEAVKCGEEVIIDEKRDTSVD